MQMLQEAGPPQDSSQRLSHALSTFERAAAQVWIWMHFLVFIARLLQPLMQLLRHTARRPGHIKGVARLST